MNWFKNSFETSSMLMNMPLIFCRENKSYLSILNMIWSLPCVLETRETNFLSWQLSNRERNWLKLIITTQPWYVFVFEISWTRVRTFYTFLVIVTRRAQSRSLKNKWLKSDKNWISNQHFPSENIYIYIYIYIYNACTLLRNKTA